MIREQAKGDREAVRGLLTAAFPTPLEADLVERLEADGAVLLALVDERDGTIAGQALFSRMSVEIGGVLVPAAGLASPLWHRQGPAARYGRCRRRAAPGR